MTGLSDKVFESLKRLKDPSSGAPILLLEADVKVNDLGEGVIHVLLISRDAKSPNIITLAEAVKRIAGRCEGVKKVVVEVRNHFLADVLNRLLNP